MQYYHVPNRDHTEVLFSRLRVVQTPWFGMYVHWLRVEDEGNLHNHPWSFGSVVLRGGYRECVERFISHHRIPHVLSHDERTWRRLSYHRIHTDEFHMIIKLLRKPTITLLFVGNRDNPWGFLTHVGYVDKDVYMSQRRLYPPHGHWPPLVSQYEDVERDYGHVSKVAEYGRASG